MRVVYFRHYLLLSIAFQSLDKMHRNYARGRMNDSASLNRITLIRDIYRSLLNTGRSYSAFTDQDRMLFQSLKGKQRVLDPMSGYGLLTRFCAESGINSYCLEYNMPLYLWQILRHPRNVAGFITCVQKLLAQKSRWPKAEVKAVISDKFFPNITLEMLKQLLVLNGVGA